MGKVFNINGVCRPDRHYMVALRSRLEEIRKMVDSGAYFTINRARQYGKTTTLRALADARMAELLDFLAQLRAAYLDHDVTPAFWSVILAGVYDIRNIRRKLRPDGEHKEDSPWTIAADFRVDMSFSAEDIAGMLEEYESDHHTNMNIRQMSNLLYEYTSGYPYLVSWLCKCMEERVEAGGNLQGRIGAWTREGFLTAVKMLLEDINPLFDSLNSKLDPFPELNMVLSRLLFQGERILYNADDKAVRNAKIFGFVKIQDSSVQIANRIFEMRLYNRYLLDYKEQNKEGDISCCF